MKIFAETERLILREVLDSDLESFFELDSDPEVHRYLGNKPVKSIDESQKMIDGIRQQYVERGIGRWVVIEKSSGNFIGWSGLRLYTEQDGPFNGMTNFHDVGYRLLPRYWGKGYATESGKASIDYAFKHMHLPIVYGITEMSNQASHNALLKVGLEYVEDFYHEKLDENLRWYKIETHELWKKDV